MPCEGENMKLRILVFDLDESLRQLLSIIARGNGHEVLSFPEPSACPLYTDSGCRCPRDAVCGDLVIIDNHMLKMSAMGLLRKQLENGCKVAVHNKLVLSTSGSDQEELRIAKEMGFTLLNKPFKLKEISEWIDGWEKRIDPNRKLVEIS
jgi:CheY-like chemotaxis protein